MGDVSRALEAYLALHAGQLVPVRPDRYVAGAFSPDAGQRFLEEMLGRMGAPSTAVLSADAG